MSALSIADIKILKYLYRRDFVEEHTLTAKFHRDCSVRVDELACLGFIEFERTDKSTASSESFFVALGDYTGRCRITQKGKIEAENYCANANRQRLIKLTLLVIGFILGVASTLLTQWLSRLLGLSP